MNFLNTPDIIGKTDKDLINYLPQTTPHRSAERAVPEVKGTAPLFMDESYANKFIFHRHEYENIVIEVIYYQSICNVLFVVPGMLILYLPAILHSMVLSEYKNPLLLSSLKKQD